MFSYFKLLSLIGLSTLIFVTTGQLDTVCTLPKGLMQSVCIHLHRCNHFWSIVKEFGGNPPPNVRTQINEHKCGSNLVCCPDGAVSIITTTTLAPIITPATKLVEAKIATDSTLPPLSDLTALKNHPNIELINSDNCGKITNPNRIVGGVEANLFEFPYLVLLSFRLRTGDGTTFGCGGSLISDRYVLTAAHCVNRDLISVRFGEHTIGNITDCDSDGICADPVQDIDVEDKIKHPKYSAAKKINDIALLRLSKSVDLKKNNVGTICLPIDPVNQIDNLEGPFKSKMLIAGFGKVGNTDKGSDVLMKAYVPFLTTQECAEKFAQSENYKSIRIYSTYLCAGGHNKTDTCRGDSGGPIASISQFKTLVRVFLYGVVSAGLACERSDVIFPGIYTNIGYYLDWILDNMRS